MTKQFDKNMTAVIFGEAMIELSGITTTQATIGVAGDTFNTAVYLSRQGVNVQYATALGCDQFSARIREALENENIKTDLVLDVPDRTPGLYAISVDDEGERTFDYWRSNSAARKFFDAVGVEIALSIMSSANMLYLSGITLSVLRDRLDDVISLAAEVRKKGGEVIFDTNYRANGWSSKEEAVEAISRFAPYVSMALPTLEDDCALFDLRDEMDCVEKWQGFGAAEIVVKAGAKGAYIPGIGWVQPPHVIKPKDTTGAGDSFNGGYLGARIMGKNSGCSSFRCP